MLKIVSVPDKILSSSTRKVEEIDERIKKLIKNMETVLIAQDDPPGVGLAANQVGVNLSIFIIRPTQKSKIKVFINPKIIKTVSGSVLFRTVLKKDRPYKKKPIRLEGCLSIPRIWGPVKRANKVLLEYQDLTSPTYEVKLGWFQGFEATIIQHEMDHLNGIVFTQRTIEQKKQLYKEDEGELIKIELI